MPEHPEVTFRGLPISKGIGIGVPIFFHAVDEETPRVPISEQEVDGEIDRYRKALHSSREDVKNLQQMSLKEGPPEIAFILGTHLEMMQDPLITQKVEERIRDQQQTIESIFCHLIEEYKARFATLTDSYFQERVRDIIDVSRRILGHLRPYDRLKMAQIPHNAIVFTQELVPSQTVEANASSISAFVTAAGGLTSHAAIIARAKGIPYVANIDIKLLQKMDIHNVIVDGAEGILVVNPTHKTLKKFQERRRFVLAKDKLIKSASHLRGETIDGYEIRILANLENPKEIDLLLRNGAGGVGLFRSEYLFFSHQDFPTEEEQFAIYKRMAKSLKGNPLVIRVFDIGGDKKWDVSSGVTQNKYLLPLLNEVNPSLGCRAIRFLLRYPEILETQLRAILRASAFGHVQILIPMVADVSELKQVREKVRQIRGQLEAEGCKMSKEVPIGCMIEVPSSAIMCDALSEEADFLSIGTNDLVQYVMAADRTNPSTSHLYFAAHPSILRLIRMIVSSANTSRKPLILCGESAADPSMVPLLIGLGIREFSVAARHIPLVKHTIRKWRILEACRLAEGALEYGSSQELNAFLAAETAR